MKDTRGFTLAEIMVAFALFAMVMSAMAAIYAMALQGQTRTIAATTLGDNATMLEHALQLASASASYVQVPPPNTASITAPPSGAMLVSWDNTDPLDGSVLDATVPTGQTFREFCLALDRSGPKTDWEDVLYRYEKTNAAWPVDPVSPSDCGSPGPGGNPIVVAGRIRGMSIDATFNRIGNNDLQLSYTLNYSPAGDLAPLPSVSETTQLTLEGSLQAP